MELVVILEFFLVREHNSMNTIQVILGLQQIPRNYPMWQTAVYLLMTHGIGCDPRIFRTIYSINYCGIKLKYPLGKIQLRDQIQVYPFGEIQLWNRIQVPFGKIQLRNQIQVYPFGKIQL